VRSWPFVISGVLGGAYWLACAACAGPASPVGVNHACFRALDCVSGLVCVEGRCTADLGPIVPEAAGPAPGANDENADAAPE
jgi:hypothetical protein